MEDEIPIGEVEHLGAPPPRRAGLLPDPGDRHGWERAVYRVGNGLALAVIGLCLLACAIALIACLLALILVVRAGIGLF
jgi:hypothetical protein